MGVCRSCRADNPAEASFCMACGARLAIACARCGNESSLSARFCSACGASLAEEQDLREEILRGEILKLVTVLFVDVVGSTERAERMHPEDVRALMADFFQAMSEQILIEGGAIERIMGDDIMAVFGFPTAHEDDPVRAVRAARRMLERLEKWNIDKDESSKIAVRIGINTGEVSAAGGPHMLLTGDAVNTAARLQKAADPGTILVGERTARDVRAFFQLEESEPLALKGLSAPVGAWRVERELDPVERGSSRLSAPLVGRDSDLEMLRNILDRVKDQRRAHVVAVIGDAGVGKSRLASEFVTSLEEDIDILWGRCVSTGGGVTLGPFRDMLRADAALEDTDPPEVALDKLVSRLQELIPRSEDLPRIATALASTMTLALPDDPLAGLDPRELYRELLAAWRRYISAKASNGPLVLFVEDLHAADDTTLDVLLDLAQCATGPLLLLCTTRPELLSSRPQLLSGLRNYTGLSLESLPDHDSDVLVVSLLGTAVPDQLRERILDKAEGNPLFIEEIVRQLLEEGALRDLRASRQEGTTAIEIPDTVQGVILARLDLLDPAERHIVQRAAVIGRVFWSGALQHLLDRHDVDEALASLERKDLIDRRLSSSMAGDAEYIFKHVLIRDAAYETLPRRDRGSAHARVADWIQSRRGERVEELAEPVAHHFYQAYLFLNEEPLRVNARRFALAAARNALRRFAIHQADSFGRRAVELSMDGSERVEALESLGDLHALTFDSQRAWEAYREALDELRKDGATGGERVAHLAAKAAIVPTRWAGTMRTRPETAEIERVIRLGLEAVDEENHRARSLLLSSRAFLQAFGDNEPDETGVAAAEQALAIAEGLSAADLISAAIDAKALTAASWAERRRLDLKRIELVPALSDVREITDAYAMSSESARGIGLYAESIRLATECIERARGVDAGSYLHGLVERVGASFMAGDWTSALRDQGEIEDLQAESGDAVPGGLAIWAYGTALLCHELRGDESAVMSYVGIARAFNESRAQRGLPSAAYRAAPARALAHRGQIHEAREWLSLEKSYFLSSHLEAWCDVVAEAGDWAQARELIPFARAEAERQELLALPRLIDRLEGRMATSSGDLRLAVTLLSRSAEGFEQLGAPWEQAWSNLLLAEALLSLQEEAAAERVLSAARAIFRRMGSVKEEERAESLLAGLGAG